MNLESLKQSAIKTYHSAKRGFDNHKPEIKIVSGLILVIGGTVAAVVATTKLPKVMEDTRDRLDVVHERMEDTKMAEEEGIATVRETKGNEVSVYPEKDNQRALVKVYAVAGLELAKLYAPTIISTAMGSALIISGMKDQKDRNLAVALAYTAEHNAFKKYREGIVERFGKEIDDELNLGIKEETIVEDVVDENGEVHKVEKKVKVATADPTLPSPYAKYFDACSDAFEDDHEVNMYFLRAQEARANNEFHAKGYLTLNDCYKWLGLPLTRSGYEIGWIDEKDPNKPTKYISFGIYDGRKSSREFVSGYERDFILLDFNVDGYVRDKLPLDEV